jgi:hypothetical protein
VKFYVAVASISEGSPSFILLAPDILERSDASLSLTIHQRGCRTRTLSHGPPWAHCLGGYQDRLLGGPLGLPDLCHTVPDGVRRKDYGGEVLG